jgi:primosomal protein N' (replication factor Y) (superfamily II helicase)
VTVARVLPDVTGLDKLFDYAVPAELAGRVHPGTIVRVPLHGRRVRGWVVAIDPSRDGDGAPVETMALKPISKITGVGPDPSLIELADWAAVRWAGRRRNFLVVASPPVAVGDVPARRRSGARPEPSSPATRSLLESGGGVLRLPPASDPLPAVHSAVGFGPTLVVVPGADQARLLGARLRRAGLSVAVHPDEWAAAAGGVDVVIGARSAAWAPCPGLAVGVVIDEHDEALQEEASPTWHARDVVVERCRRAGAPFVLVSPAPTVTATTLGPLVRPSAERERAGWPIVEVVDRRDADPRTRSLVTSELIRHLRNHAERVVCVTNATGRARLLACRTCRELARCERCGAAVGADDAGLFTCPRCSATRPAVCVRCGGGAFANLRPGVTRLREELEAAAGRPCVAVTGRSTGPLAEAGVYVGTEAVLHRVPSADVVAFLDIDRELLAPFHRAAEHALALLVRAARVVGPRARGGRLLLQTAIPDHEVVRAVRLADPSRVTDAEARRRRDLRLPPFGALAAVSGRGAGEFVASLRDADVGGGGDRFLVRADDDISLGAALRAGARPPGARLRIAVDPPRS